MSDQSVLDAASRGERVVVALSSALERGAMYDRLARMVREQCPDACDSMSGARGHERVLFRSGGEIRFLAPHGLRGHSPDLVVIDLMLLGPIGPVVAGGAAIAFA